MPKVTKKNGTEYMQISARLTEIQWVLMGKFAQEIAHLGANGNYRKDVSELIRKAIDDYLAQYRKDASQDLRKEIDAYLAQKQSCVQAAA